MFFFDCQFSGSLSRRSNCDSEDEKNIHVTEESKPDEDDLDSKETTSGLDDDFSRTQMDRSEEPRSPSYERDDSEVVQKFNAISRRSDERSRQSKERLNEWDEMLKQSNKRLSKKK